GVLADADGGAEDVAVLVVGAVGAVPHAGVLGEDVEAEDQSRLAVDHVGGVAVAPLRAGNVGLEALADERRPNTSAGAATRRASPCSGRLSKAARRSPLGATAIAGMRKLSTPQSPGAARTCTS